MPLPSQPEHQPVHFRMSVELSGMGALSPRPTILPNGEVGQVTLSNLIDTCSSTHPRHQRTRESAGQHWIANKPSHEIPFPRALEPDGLQVTDETHSHLYTHFFFFGAFNGRMGFRTNKNLTWIKNADDTSDHGRISHLIIYLF